MSWPSAKLGRTIDLADLVINPETPLLGRGGYSTVKLAHLQHDDPPHLEIALKCMPRSGFGALSLRRTLEEKRIYQQLTEFRDDPEILPSGDTERERMTLQSLQSIVRYYGTMKDDEYLYFALEYLPGACLASILRDTSLYDLHFPTLSSLCSLTQQLVRVVFGLHFGFGMAHRDIKPGNLILQPMETSTKSSCTDWPYQVRLIDFGSVRALDHQNPSRRDSHSGTPMYMLPERAAACVLDAFTGDDSATSLEVTHPAIQTDFLRQDAWSIVSVLFEVATRRNLSTELNDALGRFLERHNKVHVDSSRVQQACKFDDQPNKKSRDASKDNELVSDSDSASDSDTEDRGVTLSEIYTDWLGTLYSSAYLARQHAGPQASSTQLLKLMSFRIFLHLASDPRAVAFADCLTLLLAHALTRYRVETTSISPTNAEVEAATLGFLERQEITFCSHSLLVPSTDHEAKVSDVPISLLHEHLSLELHDECLRWLPHDILENEAAVKNRQESLAPSDKDPFDGF